MVSETMARLPDSFVVGCATVVPFFRDLCEHVLTVAGKSFEKPLSSQVPNLIRETRAGQPWFSREIISFGQGS